MPAPFTDDWARACCAALNASAEFRAASGDRPWSIALACDPAPSAGIAHATAVDFELADGGCRAARVTAPADARAGVVLRGSYETWAAVVRGDLEPVAAVTSGRLAVERGSFMTLLPLVGPARALLAAARTVPTELAGEPTGG
jgi:putative sterol carrier protein